MSCPRSTARFGEVARPEGDDDAETSQGLGTQKNGAVGLEESAEKPKSTYEAADSGNKDQFRACDCDLRSTTSLNKPSRLYIFNKLEGLTKKRKN